MDRIALLQTFVAVAEEQGFGRAARRLGISPPAATRALAALETKLGVPLFTRSTRQVQLTEAGARYLVDVKRLLVELDDAELAVRGDHGAPRGEFAVTASVLFGRMFVAPLLSIFLARHEEVSARLLLTDQVVDMIEDEVDVAVRIAHLADSSVTAIKVGSVRRVVCGAPSYFKKFGVPKTPKDLQEASVIAFAQARSAQSWSFAVGKRTLRVRPKVRLVVNSADVAIDAALTGGFVTRVLSYQVASLVRAGKLRIVLADYEAEPVPIQLLQREGRRASVRVRAFVDYAVAQLRADPALSAAEKIR